MTKRALSPVQFTHDATRVEAFGRNRREGTHGSVLAMPGQREVLPAEKAGVPATHYESQEHGDKAYYTAHQYYEPERAENAGWHWAHQAAEVHGQRTGRLGRPVVHDVVPKPGSTVDQDPYTKEWDSPEQGSLVSDKGLDIKATHWIPSVSTAHYVEGVFGYQGTLPHVNWNQFAPKGQELQQHNWKVLRRA